MKITQEWLRDFDTKDNDNVLAFAADADGNTYVTGYSQAAMLAAAEVERLVMAVGSFMRKGVPMIRAEEEIPLLSGDGTGHTQGWLMKYTSAGALDWKKPLEIGLEGLSLQLATDSNGDVILASRSDAGDACLTKYGSRGNKMWSVSLEPHPETLLDIEVDSENTIYVAGGKNPDSPESATFVSRYESNSRYMGTITDIGEINVLTVDPDDRLVVAGNAPWGVFIGKLEVSYDGVETKELWRRQLDAGDNEVVTALATDASANVYVTGTIDDDDTSPELDVGTSDVWLAKYSRDGQRQWMERVTHSNGQDVASALVVDNGGYVYIAGHTTGEIEHGISFGEQDIWLGKYLPDGSPLWKYQHRITDEDACHGLSLDRSGNIYLAGVTQPQGAFPNDGWVCRIREEPETNTELWSLMRAYVIGK